MTRHVTLRQYASPRPLPGVQNLSQNRQRAWHTEAPPACLASVLAASGAAQGAALQSAQCCRPQAQPEAGVQPPFDFRPPFPRCHLKHADVMLLRKLQTSSCSQSLRAAHAAVHEVLRS